jgi:hypothetical protein
VLKFQEHLGKSPITSLDDFSAFLEDAAHWSADIIGDNAPGNRLPVLLRNSVHEIGPDKWGVGSYDDLGSAPDDPAPKGTIKDFLRDHPQYKVKGKDRKAQRYWHAPWWFLPTEGKRKLWEMREQGMYGGIPGKAPYWHVLDKGHGRRAWVSAHNYVGKSTEQIRAFVESRVRSFMGI